VRETRRSTQGVTLEDLKSAEQLVKKKQQQENQQRTSELQQLAATNVGSTATGTTTKDASPASSASSTSDVKERRPSWRLKLDTTDKNRVCDDTIELSELAKYSESFIKIQDVLCEIPSSKLSRSEQLTCVPFSNPAFPLTQFLLEDATTSLSRVGSARSPTNIGTTLGVPGSGDRSASTPTSPGGTPRGTPSMARSGSVSPKPPSQVAIQRRKKPKRRSTGVVKMSDLEVSS
jgi:hypothetical protein